VTDLGARASALARGGLGTAKSPESRLLNRLWRGDRTSTLLGLVHSASRPGAVSLGSIRIRAVMAADLDFDVTASARC
jgi:hypothetical protein